MTRLFFLGLGFSSVFFSFAFSGSSTFFFPSLCGGFDSSAQPATAGATMMHMATISTPRLILNRIAPPAFGGSLSLLLLDYGGIETVANPAHAKGGFIPLHLRFVFLLSVGHFFSQ